MRYNQSVGQGIGVPAGPRPPRESKRSLKIPDRTDNRRVEHRFRGITKLGLVERRWNGSLKITVPEAPHSLAQHAAAGEVMGPVGDLIRVPQERQSFVTDSAVHGSADVNARKPKTNIRRK